MTGEFLRHKIINAGYQQSEVAQTLGITPQTLESRLKANDIKVGFLIAVAKAINKNLYYFFSDYVDEFFLEKMSEEEDSPTNLGKNDAKKAGDEFILMKIAKVLSDHLSPQFDVSQKSIEVMSEAQSRILINQNELLDKLEDLIVLLKQEKKV